MKLTDALKPTFWKIVATVLIIGGLVATVQRYMYGLGAATNLEDRFPWGLWVGFDILVGVGLAAGGFIIAATVYVFNLERFKPILRPSVLTAFLGYLIVIAGLMVDLGRPWSIWHALVYWNPRSVMFEVAWCVMLYTTVLALEFSPIVLEHLKLHRALRVIKTITIPLVILGVILSTLHQSSLGSLFLIIPGRMHPLWYSEILPVLFLLSCIAAGLCMTIVESFFSSRAFGKEVELPILSELGRIVVVVLALYGTVRIQDLISRNALSNVFTLDYHGMMFLGEIIVGVIIPFFLLTRKQIRTSKAGLLISSILVLFGFVMHRVNTAITSMEHWPSRVYFPSWQESFVTFGLVATGFLLFALVARYLRVFETHQGQTVPV